MEEQKSDYKFSIAAAPDFGMVNITIPKGKTIKAEASAMVYMDSSLKMKTNMKGGFKRMLSGENLFINEFTAASKEGDIGIAPGAPGDIAHVYLEDSTVFLQNSAYLASSPDLEVGVDFQGFKGFFSGEKIFMIRCSGTGDLWFNTYGGLIEIDVKDNYVVDTGYIVGFTEGLSYDVRAVAGLKSMFFSGEGLVCRFSGEGKIWIQTRLAPAFVRWAQPFRRVEKKKND
ncbi:MAG: TIGR00266 family protein [Spirochaetaceae bacterium 4572_59]|nr:MAG: TIGR00266 family protein [Spirochaetaceae bacterium 4572_59]